MLIINLYYLLLSISSVACSNDSLVSFERVRRVVGGYLTSIDQVPYLVNIRRNAKFRCGGSLLTPKCVLTAAHCVRDARPEQFIVRGGVTYLNDFRYKRHVRRIVVHPQYDKRNLNCDLAIFVLNEPLWNAHMDTISLSDEIVQPHSLVNVSGWGLTDERNKLPANHLHAVQLSVMEQQKCQALYKDFRNITSNMFCTAANAHKDACLADSGGPVVNAAGELVGVVSWGRHNKCARANSPGVYANIKMLKPWIEQTLQQEQCFSE